MSRQYQVVWSYCTVKVVDAATGSLTIVGLGKDAILPPTANPDDVKRLLGKGAIVELGPPEPAAPAEPVKQPAPEVKPEVKPEVEVKPKQPPTNASKAEWVAYAVAMRDEGVSEANAKADAEAMSKADLITVYGNGTNGS